MTRRGSALKVALLALPFAAAVASLHAFGEPGGRAARAALAVVSYPAHDFGTVRVRVRRGSDYHAFVARTVDEFARDVSRACGASGGLAAPPRITTLVLESAEDLERFGFEPRTLDHGGVADPSTATVAVVGEGRTHHQDQDARILRHQTTHLLLRPGTPAWLAEGLASLWETASPGVAESGPRAGGADLTPLEELLVLPPAAFRSGAGASATGSARLLVAFLYERERDELFSLLRGEGSTLLEDLSELEGKWREWARRSK